MNELRQLSTMQEAIVYFSNPDNCLSYMVAMRWPNGITCPTCGRKDVVFLANQRRWQCKSVHPKRQFSVKVGTIFEDSPLGFDKWLPAAWMLGGDKNRISSYEIHRVLGVTQRTAWFMMHRIRKAMHTGSFNKMTGECEVDETFIGGKARKMHMDVRKRRITDAGPRDKTAIFGVLERGDNCKPKDRKNIARFIP